LFQLGSDSEQSAVQSLEGAFAFLVAYLTAIHFQEVTRSLQRLMYAWKIGSVDVLWKGEHGHSMWLCRVVVGLVIFALQVLLGDLNIAQSHANIFVTE
jgi:hypothetical protein